MSVQNTKLRQDVHAFEIIRKLKRASRLGIIKRVRERYSKIPIIRPPLGLFKSGL